MRGTFGSLFSCSLVPGIRGEQRNKQRKTGKIPDEHRANACSRNRAPESAYDPVPEHETEDPGQSAEAVTGKCVAVLGRRMREILEAQDELEQRQRAA